MHFTREQRSAWIESTRDSPFNSWLRKRVTGSDGSLDLKLLRQVAREYGVDGERYGHLNPGQQRMTIGNRLRGRVPESVYKGDDHAKSLPHRAAGGTAPERAVVVDPAAQDSWPFLAAASNRDLLRLQAAAVDQLRMRNVVRTNNAPLGDYTEGLFARAFDWALAKNSSEGFDAKDQSGRRFQIKGRRVRKDVPGDRQLSTLRNLLDQRFDYLAAVLYDTGFTVKRAALVPYANVLSQAAYVKHDNGWRFFLTDAVWDIAGVEDVTDILTFAAAQDELPGPTGSNSAAER